jgi:GNAT superfamily N-acetyltransferase
MAMTLDIYPATSPEDFAALSKLIEGFRQEFFIGSIFDEELAEEALLIGERFSKPDSFMLVARNDEGAPLGCLGLKPIHDPRTYGPAPIGELKRMYVYPEHRGTGAGKALVSTALQQAGQKGYRTLYLDSLKYLTPAHRLYESFGFAKCGQYNDTPPELAFYFRKEL